MLGGQQVGAGAGVPAARAALHPTATCSPSSSTLLREVGFDRMTIDAVAARAHVSKATIYRRWDGKAELVVAALRDRHVGVHNPPDTGSLRGDLIELLRATAAICTADCDLMQALTFAMRTNPELERLVRHQVLPAGRVASTAILVRAAARGEIPPEAGERELFHDLAPALTMSRIVAHGLPADDAFLTQVVDQVLIPVLRYQHDRPSAGLTHRYSQHGRLHHARNHLDRARRAQRRGVDRRTAPAALDRAGGHRGLAADGRAGRHDREHRPAAGPGRPGDHRRRTGSGWSPPTR